MENIINDFIDRKDFPEEIELNQMATLWESYIKEMDVLRSINCKKDFMMGMIVIMKRWKKIKEKD